MIIDKKSYQKLQIERRENGEEQRLVPQMYRENDASEILRNFRRKTELLSKITL